MTNGAGTDDLIYHELRAFLDKQPPGFSKTESGVEIEYLKWIFSREEAEVEIHLRAAPEPVSVISKRCGKPYEETERLLAGMAKKGLILPFRMKSRTLYMAMQHIPGIFENLPKMMDRKSAELTQKYVKESGMQKMVAEQKQMRVVPVNAAVDATSQVASYDRIRDMVKKQDLISVTPCPCRSKKMHLGERCERPIDNELSFGFMAQYRIENDFGTEIDVETALRLIDEAEEAALVLVPLNTQEPSVLCMCCGCCCTFLKGLKAFERPAEQIQSNFQARINPEVCARCGTCLKRCQMEAIDSCDDYNSINTERCIGCGLCFSTCPENAISMVARAGTKEPPATFAGLIAGIAGQRGLPAGDLASKVSKRTISSSMKIWEILYKLRLARFVIDRMAKKGYV